MKVVLLGLGGIVLAASFAKPDFWIKLRSRMEEAVYTKFLPPRYENGVYQCPWTKSHRPGISGFLWAKFKEQNEVNIPSQRELDTVPGMEVRQLNQVSIVQPANLQVTWLGHATALVQIDGVNVLTDPVFSSTIGPVRMLGLTRYRRCPCTVEELPRVDAVVISHDHFDHLDLESVRTLHQRFAASITWFVPSGTKQWLHESVGFDLKVVELSWWQEHDLLVKSSEMTNSVTFACVPAQHWCRRGMFDKNKRLWSGWVIKGVKTSVFFAGDTGYCGVFKEIGERYGPVDVALIPIGAYKPRNFMKFQHCDPEEAVKIHLEVKAKSSIGIHWGTFDMGSTEVCSCVGGYVVLFQQGIQVLVAQVGPGWRNAELKTKQSGFYLPRRRTTRP